MNVYENSSNYIKQYYHVRFQSCLRKKKHVLLSFFQKKNNNMFVYF